MKLLAIFTCLLLFVSGLAAEPRVFTALDGRQVEAEFAGLRGAFAVLNVNGKFAKYPVAELSVEDQAYIKNWMQKRPAVKLFIRTSEIDGKNADDDSAGPSTKQSSSSKKGDSQRRATESYHHYRIDVTNQSDYDSGPLELKMVVFVEGGKGDILRRPLTITLNEGIQARSQTSVKTRTITTRTVQTIKRTAFEQYVYDDGQYRTDTEYRKEVDRSTQSLEGIWVKAYQKGKLVGERNDQSDSLRNANVSF